MITYNDFFNNIFKLIRKENTSKIKTYIKNGGDLEVRDLTQKTPLLYSCWVISNDIIKILIRSGADTTAKDNLNKDMSDYLKHSTKNINENNTKHIIIPAMWYYMILFPNEMTTYIIDLDWTNKTKYSIFIDSNKFYFNFFELLEILSNEDSFKDILIQFRNIFPNKYKNYLKKQQTKKFNL